MQVTFGQVQKVMELAAEIWEEGESTWYGHFIPLMLLDLESSQKREAERLGASFEPMYEYIYKEWPSIIKKIDGER